MLTTINAMLNVNTITQLANIIKLVYTIKRLLLNLLTNLSQIALKTIVDFVHIFNLILNINVICYH